MEQYLLVGLGNPGSEYARTRHNAGFRVIDQIAEKQGVSYWKQQCGALVGTVTLRPAGSGSSGVKEPFQLILAKPQSYMNTSGGPVKKLCEQYGISPDHLIVVHDELDIPPATARCKRGGGHAGHNGLRSIIDKLQTPDWKRVRVGIGRPPGRMPVVDFVLSEPKGEAKLDFEEAIDRASAAVFLLLEKGFEAACQVTNQIEK